jgi:hypothetical protein
MHPRPITLAVTAPWFTSRSTGCSVNHNSMARCC